MRYATALLVLTLAGSLNPQTVPFDVVIEHGR